MRSMTAFGNHAATLNSDCKPPGELVWELRSVNHRYLDVTCRLPEHWQALEPEARRRIGARVQRGKLEARLHWRDAGNGRTSIELHTATLHALGDAIARVRQQVPDATVDVMHVLAWPGVVDTASRLHVAPELETAALDGLERALADLVAQRQREGDALATLLDTRAGDILALVQRLRTKLPDVLRVLREKQLARLAELDLPHDSARLEQELVYAAQRLDIDEELTRLEAHVSELRHSLTRDEPVGRRLDFLMQEFNREANTLSSKAADSESTAVAVELKVLIEQMREQVQNVE